MKVKSKTRRNIPLKKKAMDRFEKIRYAVFIFVPVLLVVASVYLVSSVVRAVFRVNGVVFTGNEHLTDEELRNMAGLKGGENLLFLSGRKMFEKMSESPWIRAVSVRKELPDRLSILIEEAEPFALLDMKGRLFFVDDQGKMLEELRDSPVPFLPVISGDPFEKKEAFKEAISLAREVKGQGLLSRKDHVEIIALQSNEMSINLDGVLVKVGSGEYAEKLGRLAELEEEIKKRQIPVDYIDLRFANRVVVKPVNEVIR